MDVNDSYPDSKINEYLNWLEVALRAQVICNVAFSRRFAEIKRFISSGAYGRLSACSLKDEFRRKFDRLAEMASAVSTKYSLPRVDYLRAFFRAHRHLK